MLKNKNYAKKDGKEVLLKTISEGVEKALNEDNYLNFLKLTAPFISKYSPFNSILIALQKPEARYLKTFKGWQKAGYKVKKGEKAIGILAPAPYKIKAENEGEEDKEIMYFKEMKVFDISQVEVFNKELAEGSNIPEYKEPTKLSGDEAKELYIKSISTLINEYKMNIAEESISRGNGYYSPSSKAIRIEQDLEYNHKFKTLIHELAHHIYNINKTDEGLEIAEMELKAETTAYMVCQTLGIDSSDFSFEYLAAWGKNTENVVEKFLKNYKDILDGVNEIIEKIGA